MSSLCNRMYDEGSLGLLGPRRQSQQHHGIRTRRPSTTRKIQLHCRDDALLTADFLYTFANNSDSSSSPLLGQHHHHHHHKKQQFETAAFRTINPSSYASSTSSSSYSASSMISSPTSYATSAATTTSSAISSSRFMSEKIQSAGGLSSHPVTTLHNHYLGVPTYHQQYYRSQGSVPLPPAAFRMDMPGSPLSPFPAQVQQAQQQQALSFSSELEMEMDEPVETQEEKVEYTFPPRPAMPKKLMAAAARGNNGNNDSNNSSDQYAGAGALANSTRYIAGRSAGAGGLCGGNNGDSPVPSGIHPGQGGNGNHDEEEDGADNDDSKVPKPVPSAYTFRRRNAIVEGSEDAPRASAFPDCV
ncbi:hypothetical protein EDD11_003554 [Mortierella claussenii]|nr:hypothetical protein EDD11_003554 [Mortierella claussenii]